jgi:hypothetical protein
LTVNNIDIVNLINNIFNDLSEYIYDLPENVMNSIFDLPENIINKIFVLSENMINIIFDLPGNIKIDIFDLSENADDISQNLNELKFLDTDLSGNVAEVKQVMIYKS